jgi:hypothetical protein
LDLETDKERRLETDLERGGIERGER